MTNPAILPPADPAFDPECFDFVEYVAWCRGLQREEAAGAVRTWLMTYEPSEAAKRAIGRASEIPPPPASGVYRAIPAPELARTGTAG
jgi:hypothetical protein